MERIEQARAKVNLTLHITGQRDDGYHLLDSLVMFADDGDDLFMWAGMPTELVVEGHEAADVPTDHRNSVLKMADASIPDGNSAKFLLHKNLPTSAGIGGGTADAAAAFRLIAREWPDVPPANVSFKADEQNETVRKTICTWAVKFGADVPVCLFSKTARMRGIGDCVTPQPNLPRLHALLVNPRVAVSTPEIFSRIKTKSNPPMEGLRHFADAKQLIGWLKTQRNDMQQAAISVAPVIETVLSELAAHDGCALARMSGSGATCFGLFASAQEVEQAAKALRLKHPSWWSLACQLGDAPT